MVKGHPRSNVIIAQLVPNFVKINLNTREMFEIFRGHLRSKAEVTCNNYPIGFKFCPEVFQSELTSEVCQGVFMVFKLKGVSRCSESVSGCFVVF
jgi:hypothetical protein